MAGPCRRCGGDEWYERQRGGRDCAICSRRRNQQWEQADPRRRLFHNARSRARAAGVPFAIELEDIVIPTHCPALGIALEVQAVAPGWSSPSLDRLRPSEGYVPGNIVVLSTLANQIKSEATSGQIRLVAEWLEREGH